MIKIITGGEIVRDARIGDQKFYLSKGAGEMPTHGTSAVFYDKYITISFNEDPSQKAIMVKVKDLKAALRVLFDEEM